MFSRNLETSSWMLSTDELRLPFPRHVFRTFCLESHLETRNRQSESEASPCLLCSLLHCLPLFRHFLFLFLLRVLLLLLLLLEARQWRRRRPWMTNTTPSSVFESQHLQSS